MTRRRRCFGPNYAWLHRSSVQQMYEKRVVTRRRSSPHRRRDAYRGSPPTCGDQFMVGPHPESQPI